MIGVIEEDGAGLVFPARVARGKILANIAKRGRAEQGIHDGVNDGVTVGVAGESQFKGDGDAAEDERAVWCEGVNVVAGADAHGHKMVAPLMKASAISTSSQVVILMLVYEPGKMATRCPRRSSRTASSVTSACASGALCAE